MVNLKDIIATVLNDMASARVEADVESLRIAEIYLKDKLLRNMPIPKMKLMNFTLTLPLAIDKLDEKQLNEARKPLTPESLREIALKSLTDLLSRRDIGLTELDNQNIKSLLKDKLEVLARNKPWIMTQVKPLSDEIGVHIEPFVRKVAAARLNADELAKAIDELRADIRASLHNLRPSPPNLDVVINTASLNNISEKEKLVHMTINVDETGLEWSVYESSTGETREKLVPE